MIKTDKIRRYVLELENIVKNKMTDDVILNTTDLRNYYIQRQKEIIELIKDHLEINNEYEENK
jgi:hypothetical protein|tara:strand:- start:364 stop:552 length:189 start_codon:yes stop_codon:yes gene_type:complete